MALVNYLIAYLTAREEEGQGMIEYGLIIALVAVVAIAGFTILGTSISGFIGGLGAKLGG